MKTMLATVVLLATLVTQGTAQSFSTLECSVHSHQILPFSGGSGYRFQETCEYELITTCSPDGSQQVPIHIQVDFINEKLEVGQFAIQWMDGIAIIGEDISRSPPRNGRITISVNNAQTSVRIEAPTGIITVERILGRDPNFSIRISSSSDVLSQLCGLCGDRQGNLRLRSGQTVDPGISEDVAIFAADFRVLSADRILQNTRQECVPPITSTLVSTMSLTTPLSPRLTVTASSETEAMNMPPSITSTSISPTTSTIPLSPETFVDASSEIEATSTPPSDGPMVQAHWIIIGVVVAAAAVLVVGSVIVAVALIVWRVRRSSQGGGTFAGVLSSEGNTTLFMQDNPSYIVGGLAVQPKSIHKQISGNFPPEAGTFVTLQYNPSYITLEETVVLEPNPCYLATVTDSGYESIGGDGKGSSGGNYSYI